MWDAGRRESISTSVAYGPRRTESPTGGGSRSARGSATVCVPCTAVSYEEVAGGPVPTGGSVAGV